MATSNYLKGMGLLFQPRGGMEIKEERKTRVKTRGLMNQRAVSFNTGKGVDQGGTQCLWFKTEYLNQKGAAKASLHTRIKLIN